MITVSAEDLVVLPGDGSDAHAGPRPTASLTGSASIASPVPATLCYPAGRCQAIPCSRCCWATWSGSGDAIRAAATRGSSTGWAPTSASAARPAAATCSIERPALERRIVEFVQRGDPAISAPPSGRSARDDPTARRRPPPPNGDSRRRRSEGSALDVFRNRPFLLLWLAQAFTQIGGNMVIYGLTVIILEATSSNTAVSLLILTFLGAGRPVLGRRRRLRRPVRPARRS